MQFCSADPDLEGCVTRSEKMRGGLTVKNLSMQSGFLQKLFRYSAVITPPQNTRVFTFESKTKKFCDAEYIQISGTVYRNSERLYLLASPSAKTSERRDISR